MLIGDTLIISFNVLSCHGMITNTATLDPQLTSFETICNNHRWYMTHHPQQSKHRFISTYQSVFATNYVYNIYIYNHLLFLIVCLFIYSFIIIDLHIYIYIHICLHYYCLFTYKYVYIYMHISVCVYVCIYVYVCVCVIHTPKLLYNILLLTIHLTHRYLPQNKSKEKLNK